MTETESQPQQTEDGQILLRAKGISKGFPGVWEHLILDKIDLEIRKGEVHTLLGENGAGKTVLANILSGFYTSTGGKVFVEGKEVALHSPQDGLAHGIGMIHQEVMLAKPFTVAENVLLGNDSPPLSYPLKRVEREIEDLSQQFGLAVDPTAKVSELSAGEQQRAEILKVLYYRPQVLLLDEPTSLLTPQESQDLFQVLREMATEGFGILFITHKMEEVMKVSDRVTVLKLGEVMGERNIEETDKDELTQMMLDEKIPIKLERKETVQEEKTLNVNDLSVAGQAGERKVLNLSFEVMQGEILGVAGVSGNGQSELIEALTGLREPESGMVEISGENMTGAGSRAVIEQDVAHMPEKRRDRGVVESMSVAENIVLKDYRTSPFCRWFFLNHSQITEHARELVERFSVIAPNLWKSNTRILSGGNIQRLILGRETWREPSLIIASHPTHGLDRKAVKNIWELFMDLREKGTSILLVSEDLDEVLSLSDRVAVMFEGTFVDTVDPDAVSKQEIGLLMTGGSS